MSSLMMFESVIEKVYILIFCSCKFVCVSFIIHDNSQIATVFIVTMGDAGFFTVLTSSFVFSRVFLFPLFFNGISALVVCKMWINPVSAVTGSQCTQQRCPVQSCQYALRGNFF